MRIAALICPAESEAAGEAAREWLAGLDPRVVLSTDSRSAIETVRIVAGDLQPGPIGASAVATLRAALPDTGNALVVADGPVIAQLLGEQLGASIHIPQDPGAVSLLALDDSRDQVLAVNITPLDPLRRHAAAGADVGQRLILLRHGESQTVTDDGRLQSGGDVPLTDRGLAMAAALSPLLAPLGLTEVHSSDQLRTRQTARGGGRRKRHGDTAHTAAGDLGRRR